MFLVIFWWLVAVGGTIGMYSNSIYGLGDRIAMTIVFVLWTGIMILCGVMKIKDWRSHHTKIYLDSLECDNE